MINSGVQLRKANVEELLRNSLHNNKCVICQANDENVVGHEAGKKRILEVAELRKDIVYERLKTFGSDFVYHQGNQCYKSYTHKKHTLNLNAENNGTKPCEQYECKESSNDSKCVVCDYKSHNGKLKKYRITDAVRAQKFLDAKAFFKDAVNNRTTNILQTRDILERSVYCHKDCIKSYLQKYELDSKKTSDITPNTELKKSVIIKYFETLLPQLKNGLGFSLSDIRNNIKIIHEIEVSNKYIQKCVFEEFGDEIRLASSAIPNKSALIFHSTVRVEEVIDFLRQKDEVRDCARKLLESFKSYDFGMSDEFCDAINIKKAWRNTKIPTPILSFLAELLNFKISDFEEHAEPLDVSESEDQHITSNKSKSLKIKAIFQIIYYVIHNGTQRTPLHVLNGLAVHDVSKSSSLVKSMNHIGVGISYDEVLRHRNDLARYTVLSTQKDNVPLPSNFDVNMFTTAAFDNFDHNEDTFTGSGSSHDTVSVLFQDQPQLELKKPKLSESSIKHRSRTFRLELNCQKLKEFQKPSKTAVLPENYVACKDDFPMDSELYDQIQKKELAWEICRLNPKPQNQDTTTEQQVVPTWGAFNSVLCQEKKTETQIVGFLPIIPRPVTEYGTVYTALHNFLNVLEQLKQSKLPVTCDEGVYQIARHIMLLRPNEFDNIVLMMGPFHLAKIVLACIGKYLKGSGADMIFIESSVFGPAVTETVLNGKDYARTLKAFILLSETLRRLQFQEFFKRNDVKKYSSEMKKLDELRQCFAEKDLEKCKTTFKEFNHLPNSLQRDFEKFVEIRRSESELFKYWDNVIYLISVAKDIVRADRERDGSLHLGTLQKTQPILAAFDRHNYLRWGSLYFEDMRRLKTSDPELYDQLFIQGKFSIKRCARSFSSVGADMCLEQSINKSKKSSRGVIGQTRNKQFVTEWELVYHEILAVSNLYRNLTNVGSNINYELRHHEYTESETKRMEDHINSMQRYILAIGNPFADGSNKLINIATHQEVHEKFKNKILDVVKIGNEIYGKFRKERFLDKTEMISSVIHHSNVPMFNSKIKSLEYANANLPKRSSFRMRIIDLARERGYGFEKLFSFELADNQFFIDQNGLLSKTTGSITAELEKKYLTTNIVTHQDNNHCCCIVNVMHHISKVHTGQLKTFGDLVISFLNSIIRILPSKTTRIDFIFESLLKSSPKFFENECLAPEGTIRMNKIEKDTLLPVTMSLFWASTQNEMKLQKFTKAFILNSFEFATHINIYCSAIMYEDEENQCESVQLMNRNLTCHPCLGYSNIEQGYMRIMPHILHATKEGYKKVIILFGGDDESILSLYNWRTFQSNGLHELWIRLGSETTPRNVPIHILGNMLGKDKCASLLPAHMLTGSSRTSKFGTKYAAINAPYSLLENFGRIMNYDDSLLFEEIIENAERYLVQVLKMGSKCESLNELRVWIYLYGNFTSLEKLPPTSRSTREHILRAAYHTHMARNCLIDMRDFDQLDPQQFGYKLIEDSLRPRHTLILYPNENELVPSCSCGKCATKSCSCFRAGVSCCIFCKCNSIEDGICHNAFSKLNVTNKRSTDEKAESSTVLQKRKRMKIQFNPSSPTSNK